MKNPIQKFEDFVNEAQTKYTSMDFPIGTLVHMGDEIWIVVKPGAKFYNVYLKPHNNIAKEKYVSVAIQFDINWLNSNITMLEK